MAYDEGLAERVREELAGDPGISEKRMFGGLAFLLGGHLAVVVSGSATGGGLMLRVPPERTDELAGEPGGSVAVMRGRPMTGWVRVSAEAVDRDESLIRWVGTATAYARGLPAKV